ncbi:sterol desaturase family protein [Psychromonas sp. RZ5]|uniref:sterol desaturase family protein n=2 Tax=Psychromonas algicola TaxID=2555642 RepID=UPI00106753DE|nr:sterol desaturase family protein [Psychromonas sp. RZ5]TEW49246.1 sterol desaturase family protein [Psychromonas sp. RZ5]
MTLDDTSIRLIVFFSVLLLMIILELCFPARRLSAELQSVQSGRLLSNYGILIISNFISKLVLPLGLASFAMHAADQQWGLFNILQVPTWLSIVASVLLLDMLIYWQHRLFHKIPLLWHLHKVHHADPHVDVSTALRFHPIEIVASIFIKMGAVFILGVPAVAVILFEVLLNGFAIFNHANIRLPKKVEAVARTILMTQILHRIHHSQLYQESNSNFGFSVIWWDRLFGSYTDEATKPDTQIDIGLVEYPETKENAQLWGLLSMPFKRK